MFAIFIHRLNAFLDGREWHCWCCCCCDFSAAAASWTSAWMMTLWQKVATNLVETTYNDWWWCRWRSFCSISHNRWPESHAAANVNPFAMSICGMERALPPLRNAMGLGVLHFERLLLLYFRHRSVNPSNLEFRTTTNCWLLSPP